MSLRAWLRHSETAAGFVHDVRKIGRVLARGRSTKTIETYVATHRVRKLQLGAGTTALDGWLSTDLFPASPDGVYLDVVKSFPISAQTFDYVCCEHMIEHISRAQGLTLLRECRRILKPDGIVRIATPDLEVLVGLYHARENALAKRYIAWITDRHLEGVHVYRASFVINNAFRNWGHQFLYDGELLEMAMRDAGFVDLKRHSPGESDDEHLRGIESHGENVGDDEMNRFETMVYEGKCPS